MLKRTSTYSPPPLSVWRLMERGRDCRHRQATASATPRSARMRRQPHLSLLLLSPLAKNGVPEAEKRASMNHNRKSRLRYSRERTFQRLSNPQPTIPPPGSKQQPRLRSPSPASASARSFRPMLALTRSFAPFWNRLHRSRGI